MISERLEKLLRMALHEATLESEAENAFRLARRRALGEKFRLTRLLDASHDTDERAAERWRAVVIKQEAELKELRAQISQFKKEQTGGTQESTRADTPPEGQKNNSKAEGHWPPGFSYEMKVPNRVWKAASKLKEDQLIADVALWCRTNLEYEFFMRVNSEGGEFHIYFKSLDDAVKYKKRWGSD